jgi:hypothetical protein
MLRKLFVMTLSIVAVGFGALSVAPREVHAAAAPVNVRCDGLPSNAGKICVMSVTNGYCVSLLLGAAGAAMHCLTLAQKTVPTPAVNCVYPASAGAFCEVSYPSFLTCHTYAVGSAGVALQCAVPPGP